MEKNHIIADIPCEQLVIGTLLNRPQEWLQNADILSADLFYGWQTADIYKAGKTISDQGEAPDIVNVLPQLQASKSNVTPAVLAEISSHVCFVDFRTKILRLLEMKQRRELQRIGMMMATASADEAQPVEASQSKATEALSNLLVTASTSIQSIASVATDFTQNVVTANLQGSRTVGLPTGFKQIDQIGGFQLSDLVIIAADSSQGKTSLAINIADHVAAQDVPVSFYSMEMTARQLFARMIASKTGIPSNIINTCALTLSQKQKYDDAAKQISRYPIFFDERSTSSLDSILASIRTLAYRKHIQLAIIDYLQILNVNTKSSLSQEQLLGDAARRLKNLAKELNICVVLLSQLSRDRDNPRPTLSRLRGSGQINEAADMTIFVYRPEVYGIRFSYPDPFAKVSTQATAMIDMAKGRNVGTRRFIVSFNAALTTFTDLPQDQLPMKSEQATNEAGDDVPF